MPDRSVRPAWLGWLTMILASWSVCAALQYQPLEIYGNGEECALILDGPGRTNVFDYTYNLLRGSFRPSTGAQTCITYDAVNHAYIEARKRIKVARPKSEMWRPEDLATVGELLLDISRNLAQTYGLSAEEIEKSLPLIDTSKTLIREVCPAFLSNVECRPGKYRRYDGLCTNLQNPTWGATLSPFTRLLPPRFADSLTAPRISVTGHELPLSRVVSRTMHPDEGYHDHAGTVMVIAWGQFMDHDYTLTGTPLDPLNRNDPEECCNRPPHLRNPYCNEILIPEDDYFYRLFNIKCMDFVRAFPAVRPGCRLGSRVPFNLLTGVLDGNTVYGITEAFARKLRTGYGGLLRMNPVFQEYGLKDLLPLKLDIPDEGCTRPNRSMYCFEAGEIRVNEQLVLTCMHTLLAREHNRIAKTLTQVNPHWDDETLFQESRRIVIAEIQHITYNEFLPILLGKDVMEKFGLLLEKNGYWDGYDESVNPGVIDAFASAAFRFGHSLLPTAVERWSKAHKFIASKRLSDLIRRPYDLYRAGVLDEYFMGLMNQVAQAMDDSITQEVTNHLFKKVGAKFGMDLVSFNMQRGREFGIPSYMEFRKFCGLPGADTFDELFGSMPNETIRRYSSIFEHPSDVDLWSGGVSERPLPGSMLGPTFACIIATQFSYSRRGDRFWYELPNQPSSFTLDQLNEIRKTKLSKLICDNTDLIDTVQIYPMVLPDHEINPRVPCRSGVLPSMDLTKWAEFPTSSGHSAQYKAVVSPLRELLKTEGKRKLSKNKLKLERSKTKKGSTKIDKSSGSLLKRLLDLIESIVPIDRRTTINKTIVTNNIFLSGLDRDDNDNDKLRADEVAEKIRQKNKTGLDRRAEKIRSKRSKRSVKNGSTEDKNNNNSESGSDGFYRHPKLSYEDQKVRPERLESTTPREDDSGSSKEFRKRAWTTDSSNPRLKIIVAPEEHSRKTKPSEVIEDKKVIEDEKIIEDGLESFESLKQDVKRVKSDNGKSKEAVEVESIRVQESKKDYEPGESSHSNEDVKSEIRPESGTSKYETRPESGASKVGYEVRETEETNQDNKSQDNNSQDNKSQDNSQPSTDELPPYDPKNIPYVEVPDYSDVREDSLDKERHQTIDDTDTEAVDPGDGYRIEESGGKDEAQDERIQPVREESPYKPVTFDINEYRRPFNLDEFVKQFSRYTRPEDRYKGYTDFGGTWKNPGRFDFSSDFGKYRGRKEYPEDYSKFYSNPKDYSNSEQDSRGYSKDSSKEGTQESPEDYSKGYSNPKDYSNSEQDPRDYSKDSAKEGTQESPEDYSKGYSQPKDYSKGYPRVYSKDNMKEGTQDSPSTRFEDEKEFLSRHFTKDVIKRLQDVERPKKKRDQRTDELYKTLSEILEKKDRISRLNDDVDKDGGDGEPRNYKNVWFLQYSSPTGNKEQAMTN